jgi:hypothetical protein
MSIIDKSTVLVTTSDGMLNRDALTVALIFPSLAFSWLGVYTGGKVFASFCWI